MITTIIFDLGDVYIKGAFGVEYRIAEITGLKPDAILKSLTSTFWTPNNKQFLYGNMKEDDYLSWLIEEFGWNISIEQLKSVIRENFQEIEGMREIIEKLKERGYKLGLLSDHSREWIDYIEDKYKHHKLFDVIQYSFDVGTVKAERKMFESILEKLKERPENCLFIDDFEKNTDVAKSLGLRTIVFKNPEQLRGELKNMKIEV